ncbi:MULTISPECIES: SWIM zinc finger family protein [unclassified Coleofasciculus]|uniref:SWIM zinc finger family protein n=1 Tax=unclassified Coleofasciculus TaxID=2692782 RepID=UPI00187EA80F|nr:MULTISPECIES: SWIM zinc finger family protein [unclassified Coleofasciculus]MBE9124860.1 SWIM zinc finger family protein [Coleofasciculus sp. LEGE 07081]MBE9147765.1 SWIM zinc finger family protein [Coleofasciculus sp. LEGE 07092]
MPITLSPEQILALAPDASSAKNGKGLATPRKWQELGTYEEVVWGECKGSGSKPYQTQIDLVETAFKCSCPSRKFPCKHGLGLFLLLASQPDAFTQHQPPDWVNEWLITRRQKQAKKAEKSEKVTDPVAQGKRAAQREEKVTGGVQELDRWLRDLVQQGLATLPGQDYSFWDTVTARMVDAQAPGLARQLQEISGIPHTGAGWVERLLERLGRLYLLLEGFQRLETLPPATQADIRTAIGWTQKEESASSMVRDRWLILGQRVEEQDKLRTQRTWLWGQDTQKSALILNFAYGDQPLDTSLFPGTVLDAELGFFESAYPLRAVVKVRHAPPTPLLEMPGEGAIASAFAKYTKALACQPWIEQFPLTLQTVIPEHDNGGWALRDSVNNRVLLTPSFEDCWQLVALSGGHPITVFGEWNGDRFLPLSAFAENLFISV